MKKSPQRENKRTSEPAIKKDPSATYLAAQTSLSIMLLHVLPLGAFYDFGNKAGSFLTALFFLLMVIALIFVMAKYLFGKDERDNRHAA